jgi:putative transposase
MHKRNAVLLTDRQMMELQQLVGTGRESARKIIRGRILLRASQRETDEEIAEALDVGIATVQRVRSRFATGGLNLALERKPQPRRPEKRRLDGEGEAKLVMLACSSPPDGQDHWTLDLLADRMVRLNYVPAVSGDTVGRVLKKTRSSPG